MDNYAFQVNYTEKKKPYFRSDRYQFTVSMPNMNYDDTLNDTLNSKIISYMQQDCHITISLLVDLLKVSRPTITRAIKQLQENEIIERIGSKKT